MGLAQEFKEFAMKGNVVDLAVGVVIGGAFGKIVTSAVSDLVMPLVSLFSGGVNFSSLKYQVGSVVPGAIPATFNYGQFIQNIFDFTVVAFVLFMVIKAMNKMKRETPPAAPETPAQEKLLGEIRDLLKDQNLQRV